MLYYHRIDAPERIYVNKSNESRECDICRYWYFCKGCHDVLMVPKSPRNIGILNINGEDFHCIINAISKSEAINLLQNINLSEKSRTF